jgi:RND family efflux transporter MFP subunit
MIQLRSNRALRIAIATGAVLLGGGTIVLARHYQRPDPPEEVPAPGMTVGSDFVKLASDAPMWSVLKIAPAEPPQPRWTEPVPAKVAFDETHTSRIGSPLVGRVTAVMVERGQRVARGAQLFTVASPNLAELHADLEKATVEQRTARVNFDRVKNLVDAGSLPAKELVNAQQQTAEADLAVKLANQKLAALRVPGAGDAAFTVTAPRDGVVVEKNVAVGQNVDPAAGTVLAIADLSDVWIVADVFEDEAAGLAPGVKAQVTVGSAGPLDGAVEQVSAIVDPDRHTVPVRVRLSNRDGKLRPNGYAEVAFLDPAAASATLPTAAVMSDGARSYAYVKDGAGLIKRRPIAVGAASSGRVPVRSGITPGELVVSEGAILLDNQIQLDN